MTIHLFFVTIIIKKQQKSIEKVLKEQQVKQRMEEMKDKQYTMFHQI
ncbi:YrzI family small protein [Metabacillus arenae]|uniref:YrzI family small protein n=1 Tax=Metabacillus arenae TaxID=2771434 RepID=A0A926NK43_9BACI|nr:YrzI family small protein [Metabacillus arenae]MBD1382063.1 YrzI family small protein [Metabacillus arenae]